MGCTLFTCCKIVRNYKSIQGPCLLTKPALSCRHDKWGILMPLQICIAALVQHFLIAGTSHESKNLRGMGGTRVLVCLIAQHYYISDRVNKITRMPAPLNRTILTFIFGQIQRLPPLMTTVAPAQPNLKLPSLSLLQIAISLTCHQLQSFETLSALTWRRDFTQQSTIQHYTAQPKSNAAIREWRFPQQQSDLGGLVELLYKQMM